MSRIVRRAPGEVRYKLSLARLLTYREETRREGISMLAALARDPAVGKDATASWREALVWLAPSARDLPLLRQWLKLHPGDPEIARHLDRARNASTVRDGYAALDRGDLREAQRLFDAAGKDPDAARGRALIADRKAAQAKKAGFAALERGDLAAAEAAFHSVQGDADARLGLALVAQRQAAEAQRKEDFARARDLLERARKLAPDHREVWQEPLRSVMFWSHMRDARLAREDGRDADAEASLRAAVETGRPKERWHADLVLGDLLLERGLRSEAEARFRDVLGVVPDQPEALRALAGILVQQNRFEEAQPVNARLAKVAPQSAFRAGWLQAETLRSAAATSRAAGDLRRARDLLEKARAADPSDIWALHDLANAVLESNGPAEAAPLVSDLLRVAPALPEAQVTQARLLAAQRQDAQALAVLQKLSPSPRDRDVIAMRRRLELQVRVPQLLQEAATGQREPAARELAALERKMGGEPELAAQIAVAWSKLGERTRAVTLMRRAMARAPAAT
ncbi:MAG: tetratricopeptide repeat protein, partial [Deltaproteobacteria bacterium]